MYRHLTIAYILIVCFTFKTLFYFVLKRSKIYPKSCILAAKTYIIILK